MTNIKQSSTAQNFGLAPYETEYAKIEKTSYVLNEDSALLAY